MKFQFRLAVLIITIVIFVVCTFKYLFRTKIQEYPKSIPMRDKLPFCDTNLSITVGKLDTSNLLFNASTISFKNHHMGRDEEQMPDLSNIPAKDDPLTVFVVPHSHNDPAWLQTPEGYWESSTSLILNNVLHYLYKYPNMTFVWTEAMLLDRWFQDLNIQEKQKVIKLVDSGRLEIAGGGWIAPDEATTTTFGLIDNLIQGHSWLASNIPGYFPSTWWNLDPFGYSSVAANFVKKAGYQQSAILRINDFMKDILRHSSNVEFLWSPFWKNSPSSNLFTSIFPFLLYNYKYSCGPHPYTCLKFDFRQVPGENSESRAEPVTKDNVRYLSELLYQQLKTKSRVYKHNVVMFPIGDDFRFDRSVEWEQQYVNFQKLFTFMNAKNEWKISIQFGTPKNYFDAVRKESVSRNLIYPTLTGDFYTYIDRDYSFWSGYYTSRAYWKRMARDLEHHLRTAEILNSIAGLLDLSTLTDPQTKSESLLNKARRTFSFFQHHDSITGTSMSHVSEDYLVKLSFALQDSREVITKSLKSLLSLSGRFSFTLTRSKTTPYYPINVILPTNSRNVVYLVNSVTQMRTDCPRFRISNKHVQMGQIDNQGHISPLKCQVNPTFRMNKISSEEFEVIACLELPSLGVQAVVVDTTGGNYPDLSSCKLSKVSHSDNYKVSGWTVSKFSDGPIVLKNSELEAQFDPQTGFLAKLKNNKLSIAIDSKIDIALYKSTGSGNYIFHSADEKIMRNFYSRSSVIVIEGPIVSSVRIAQSAYNHTSSIYNTGCHLASVVHLTSEVDTFTEILNYRDTEIFMRVNTNILSVDTFYTDSNGFVFVKRKRLPTLPLSGNYYPITNAAMISDRGTRLSLLTNHAHGATSPHSGALEVILQRNAGSDDSRGNPEGIPVDYKITSDMFLLLEKIEKPYKDNSVELLMPSIVSSLSSRFLNYPPIPLLYRPAISGISGLVSWTSHANIPCDIELVNLRSDFNSSSILAVIRRYGIPCNIDRSNVCTSGDRRTISIADLLPRDSQVLHVKRTAVSGFAFETLNKRSGENFTVSSPFLLNKEIDISPNDIETFRIRLK